MKKVLLKRMLFLTIFLIGSIYILFVKSELYYSFSKVVIKNLDNKSTSLGGFSFLMPSNSSTQDAYVVRDYLLSYDELQKLDRLYHLKKHYMSDAVDIVDRLKPWDTKEDFLKLYRKRLYILFDDATGIMDIGFLHTDPKIAYAIVKTLLEDANAQINLYNKIVAQKQLRFIEEQVQKNKEALDAAIRALERFQNKHSFLDPTQTAQSQLAFLSELEAQYLQKKAKLNELLRYMNENNFDVIRLKNEIKELRKTIAKIKKQLANPKKKALNIYIFEFERLKNMVELNKELYKQALLQYEQIKVELNKNAKMLLQIVKPYLPQGYSYPQKTKAIFTLFMVLLLLYGIVSLIEAIIKEHFE